MVELGLSFKYLSSNQRTVNGGQIRLRKKPTNAYMLALCTIFIGQMRYLLITGLLCILSCSRQASNKIISVDTLEVSRHNHDEEIIKQMQGLWTHIEDSLATVEIFRSQWTFQYAGESGDDDKFRITISDTLTAFVDKKVKADFVILSNPNDTMNYEITGLTKEVMSLMYYPRGNTHVYQKVK